ncbi:MAG: ATP-dependent Clp protease proteolytic subunit, partial [Planctomycetes bacterium]|nr:ATP-dependent Clp protease proteolytic subunit [Planctomycetota bacterium]
MTDYDYLKNNSLHRFEDDEEEENGEDEKDEKEGAGDFMMKKILETRTIVIARPVTDKLYEKVINMLMLLESEDASKPIKVFVNSPGGSADSGFAIYDAMKFVKC